jgi:hypothetical protein
VVLETGIALLRRPSGEPGEEVLLPRTTRTIKEGSGNGASLFMGVLRAEPGRSECYVMKDSGNGRLSP